MQCAGDPGPETTATSLKPPDGRQPSQVLDFQPSETLTSRTVGSNACYFKPPQFTVICYSSHRKLVHSARLI